MSELAVIDSIPPRYHEYVATQERVSVWIQSTQPPCSRNVPSRRLASRKSTTDLRRSKTTKFILERSISKLPSPPPTPHQQDLKPLKLSLNRSKTDLTAIPKRRHTLDPDLPSRKVRRHTVDDHQVPEGNESISPAVALLSSSLIVCAFLPSLLTVSAFVVLLTFASMETTQSDKKSSRYQKASNQEGERMISNDEAI